VNDEARQLLEEGLRHHVLGDDEKAAACFSRILELDPANEKAKRLLEMIQRPRTSSGASRSQAPTPLPPPRVKEPDSTSGEDEEIAVLMRAVEELHQLGDFSGSLQLVEKVLQKQPNHPVAQDYLASNRKTLTHLYESKLGSVGSRPRVVLRPDEILWLNIDHRAGFLLSQIDGTLTVEDLYALSGMSRMETAKILAELLEDGVIEIV